MLWGGGVENFLQQLHEEQHNETKSISGDSNTALQVPTTLQPPEKAHSCVKAILSTGCPKPLAFFPSFLCFCTHPITEDVHRETGFLVSGSPSAPTVYFLKLSQSSHNEFQCHDHTDGFSHGEHTGKPP